MAALLSKWRENTSGGRRHQQRSVSRKSFTKVESRGRLMRYLAGCLGKMQMRLSRLACYFKRWGGPEKQCTSTRLRCLTVLAKRQIDSVGSCMNSVISLDRDEQNAAPSGWAAPELTPRPMDDEPSGGLAGSTALGLSCAVSWVMGYRRTTGLLDAVHFGAALLPVRRRCEVL